MPPEAKEPWIFSLTITSIRNFAAAKDAPPAPVWKEKPSFKSPECWITFTAVSAMMRPTGSRVIFVVPETMPWGLPMAST